MCSARVFNPMVISEFCYMRSASSPAVTANRLQIGRQVNSIKRDLFGATNSSEVTRIFNEEVEKHQDQATKKWGFDFRAGLPLGANHSQFIWERVSSKESNFAPQMYTLTRAAHVRTTPNIPCEVSSMDILMDERFERENCSLLSMSTDSMDDSQDESDEGSAGADATSTVGYKPPSAVVARPSTEATFVFAKSSPPLRKRQPKITEYMKKVKRMSQTPKKVSPAKRHRTNASGPSISHSVQAYNTGSLFALRNLKRK